MKEPQEKGVAIRLDPASRASGRKVAGEARTGAHTGQPWSSEITSTGVPTSCYKGEGHRQGGARRESLGHAAESKTLRTCGNSMRENRETPALPSTVGGAGRPEKALGRTSGMHGAGESDDLIVPTKRANNVGPTATAEPVEGRGSRKGTARFADPAPDTAPDQAGRFGSRATARRLVLVGASDPSEEPYEAIPHVRIWGRDGRQLPSRPGLALAPAKALGAHVLARDPPRPSLRLKSSSTRSGGVDG
jgi:hypothetical protein